ncbi:uncharacterized protein METZ01_LOCUS224771, partial [marine metagenome]
MSFGYPLRCLDQMRHLPIGRATAKGDALLTAGLHHLIGVLSSTAIGFS